MDGHRPLVHMCFQAIVFVESDFNISHALFDYVNVRHAKSIGIVL